MDLQHAITSHAPAFIWHYPQTPSFIKIDCTVPKIHVNLVTKLIVCARKLPNTH